ncbi:MAG: SAM-dependent methyltransferase [Betaproteobacteria bacterium]
MLSAAIGRRIDAASGWIGFDVFMDMALYEPGLGYYSGGATKFGQAGDFVTAPELSPMFGRTLARQVAQVLEVTRGEVLEIGPGSGRLAVDLLLELEQLGTLPRHYHMLELSGELRARQHESVATAAPHLLARVDWLEALPAAFEGVVIANEVLDAVPVHMVAWREDGLFERGVSRSGDGFAWSERPLRAGPLADAARTANLAPPFVTEMGLRAQALAAAIAESLSFGVLLVIDYGFGSAEFHHPQRSHGTLMCHYRHRAHDDPFFLPGLQDITAHVDFTAVAEAAVDAGLSLLGYTTQGRFLINCGITELLAREHPEQPSHYLPIASQAHRLLSPAEMGELFKVLAVGRRVDEPLLGFPIGDLSRLL